jgi:hypothetical protein
MSLPSLSSRDRRALRIAAVVLLPSLGWVYGVRPYLESLSAMRDQVVIESATLARERALIAERVRNPGLQRDVEKTAQSTAPRLFEGRDAVIASAELASYVTETAERSRVNLQQAATRPMISTAPGVRMLRIEIRGESDLEGILAFLNALETGYKLVRFDKLDISRAPGSSTEEDGFETLTFAATVSGFAVDDSASLELARPTSATKTASGPAATGVDTNNTATNGTKGGNQ